MICDFLIICEAHLTQGDIEEFLISSLSGSLQIDLDEIDEFFLPTYIEITMFKTVLFMTTVDETIHHTICCFKLEIPEEVENFQLIVDNFVSLLEADESFKHILKFYDEHLLERNLEFIPRLFELEMKLRKSISIIYLSTYWDGFYDLLRDDLTEVVKKDGNKPTEEQMKNAQENEFFHLTFSQYINLNKFKPVSDVRKLLDKLSSSFDFEHFKDSIEKVPVTKVAFQDFIASLNQTLNAIEKLRNCIAHNRTPTIRIIEDFERFYVTADELIDTFLGSLSEEQEEIAE
jgi:hypothetical protein